MSTVGKKVVKRVLIVLVIVLLMSGMIVMAGGSNQIYLMAVNDNVMDVTPENIPLQFNGQLYIPYTMLSSSVTKVNLGIQVRYSVGSGTLLILDGQKVAIFDIRRNVAYDAYGTSLNAAALTRNSMVYVPIDWLSSFFRQLSYSVTYTPYGLLVRLCNGSEALTDVEFIEAGEELLHQKYLNYLELKEKANATPSVSASPSTPPTVSPSPPPMTVAEVCLAFRYDEAAGEVADLLEQNGQRGLFLFECRELVLRDDLVRRLVAKGHQVGLALAGEDLDDCLKQLEEGRELLLLICRSPLLIADAQELSKEDRQVLKEYVGAVWESETRADDMTWNALRRALETEEINYVEFTCSEDSLNAIENVLLRLSGEEYRLRQALAPVL